MFLKNWKVFIYKKDKENSQKNLIYFGTEIVLKFYEKIYTLEMKMFNILKQILLRQIVVYSIKKKSAVI
jgi:hypothetical protein